MNRILVIRGGAIGDFILTLPVIKALRDAYPQATIDIVGYKQIAALAEKRFYADRVRSIEAAELARFFARDADLPRDLAQYFAAFDLILSYLYDPDLIFETNLRRCGVKKIIRGPSKIETSSHATEQLLQPIQALGLPTTGFAPRLFPSDEDRHRATEFLGGLNEPIIAFHSGSGSEKKNWPLKNWIELGNYFLATCLGSLLVVSGEADELQAKTFQSKWPENRRVRFATNLSLPDLAAILANTIFLGHDSGVSHLAAASSAKCILLFGPTNPTVWAPRSQNARVIRAPDGDLERLDFDLVRAALDHELMRIGIRT